MEPADAPPQRNLLDRTLDRVDHLQRRWPVVAVPVGVAKKFGEDRGGQLAMLLAYKGFFSIFPLLLAFVNVLGLVLSDNDELREDLIDSTLANVPVIGSEIQKGAESFGGSALIAVLSILLSLWAGLGLLEMLQESLNTVWGVPMYERPAWIIRRLRCLPAALLIGACAVLSGSSAWLLDDSGDLLRRAGELLIPALAGALCYLGLHWLLSSRKAPFVAQLPGAAVVGVGWTVLQQIGAWYIDRFVVRSSDTYGVFVIVFGLLSWSYLLGMIYLYGNELATVLLDRRWPRSLTGRDLTDADRAALALVAEREVRVRGTDITVDVPREPAPAPES